MTSSSRCRRKRERILKTSLEILEAGLNLERLCHVAFLIPSDGTIEGVKLELSCLPYIRANFVNIYLTVIIFGR